MRRGAAKQVPSDADGLKFGLRLINALAAFCHSEAGI